MMIHINGKRKEVDEGLKLKAFIKELNYPKSVVVFLNERKLLMKEVEEYTLQRADQIKIFRPLSGG